MTQHVICNCTHLNKIIESYFNRVHNELIDVYKTPDTTHQRLYVFHILQLLENINKNQQLWHIICGMNFFNTINNEFYYNSNVKSNVLSHLEFLHTLIGYITSWVTICKNI